MGEILSVQLRMKYKKSKEVLNFITSYTFSIQNMLREIASFLNVNNEQISRDDNVQVKVIIRNWLPNC